MSDKPGVVAEPTECECGEARDERCVDCGSDLHAPAPDDCDNHHHEFKAA